jgi:rhodanese-related sulfurtransferase
MPAPTQRHAEPRRLDPASLRAELDDGGEIALLDLREEGAFSTKGHPFFAVPAPLGRLELLLDRLVPRQGTRIVLTDADGSLLDDGAQRLRALGYSNVAVLAGGAAAWAAAGHELFTGVNVPSKAFGEVIETELGTPHVTPEDLVRLRGSGAPVVVLDSRPADEFRRMSIPGALDCPGAELVLRAREAAPDPTTRIVVNCAGRTRSIIGAQSLINAGVPNPVAALENGTMGWELAGLALEHGATRAVPLASDPVREWARAATSDLAAAQGIRRIGLVALDRFREVADTRTLYLFDVRSPEEYEAGHLPGARSAPGGQLVQATDGFAAVRNARIVLCDDDGVRAIMTASWLQQLGWGEVFVLDGGLDGPLETGAEPRRVLGISVGPAAWIDAGEAAELQRLGSAAIFDLGPSRRFREAHVPGAWRIDRRRMPDAVAAHTAPGAEVLLVAEDAALALLAVQDLAGTGVHARALLGGLDAWRAAGLAVEAGDARLLADDDAWVSPALRPASEQAAAKRAYIAWELGLVEQVRRDGGGGFRIATAHAPQRALHG